MVQTRSGRNLNPTSPPIETQKETPNQKPKEIPQKTIQSVTNQKIKVCNGPLKCSVFSSDRKWQCYSGIDSTYTYRVNTDHITNCYC